MMVFDPSQMGGLPQQIDIPGGGGDQAGGAPPDAQPPSGGGDPVALMRDALKLVRQAAVATTDDEEQAQIEKISTDIANVIANEQKLTDAMMGTTPAHKGLRRQTQKAQTGGGGGGY